MRSDKTKRDQIIKSHYDDREDYLYEPASELADEMQAIISLPPNEDTAISFLEELEDRFGSSAARMSFHLMVPIQTYSMEKGSQWTAIDNYYANNCMEAFELLRKAIDKGDSHKACLMSLMAMINYFAAFEHELFDYNSKIQANDRMHRINPRKGKQVSTNDPLSEIVLAFLEEQKENELGTSWGEMKIWFETQLCTSTPSRKMTKSSAHRFEPDGGADRKGCLYFKVSGQKGEERRGYKAILNARKKITKVKK